MEGEGQFTNGFFNQLVITKTIPAIEGTLSDERQISIDFSSFQLLRMRAEHPSYPILFSAGLVIWYLKRVEQDLASFLWIRT